MLYLPAVHVRLSLFHRANDAKYGVGVMPKARLTSTETGFAMGSIKHFKRMKEIQYLLNRSVGIIPGQEAWSVSITII